MRLIDADALKEQFGDTNMDIYADEVKEYIDEAPTIEPKRGEWGLMRTVKYNSRPEHWLKCSACGNFRIIKVGEAFPPFCENCGADMRGENNGNQRKENESGHR